MCGIGGYILKKSTVRTSLLRQMTDLIRHRGPDDEGYFMYNPENRKSLFSLGHDSHPVLQKDLTHLPEKFSHRVAFGHRRYSIIALGPEGHQPMQTADFTLIFNGEIYNYPELREKLRGKGYDFQTVTDTEVLLTAFQEYGTDCFAMLRGQFAIAVYDEKKGTLTLARDQIGKAPLYFTVNEQGLFFSSDIKPLLAAVPGIRKNLNITAISDFLYAGIRDFAHQTFWDDIRSLPSGSYCMIDVNTLRMTEETFYRLPAARLTAKDISFDTALPIFSDLLQNALHIRMRADIPIGFTLSGGMDSSALIALYCNNYDTPVPALTVRFDNPKHNEEPFARKVVKRYPDKIQHTVINGMDNKLIDNADIFVSQAEEPFLSPNAYMGHSLQKILQSKGIGINMFGAGGDELLAGYPAYLKQYLSYLINSKKISFREYSGIAKMMLGGRQGLDLIGHYLKKRMGIGVNNELITVLADVFTQSPVRQILPSADFTEVMKEKFTDHQMNFWMRNGNKYFMSVPMEMRAPFLDVDLVDFCFQLPPEYLIHNGWQKYILRKATEKILPREVVWRKYKMGFPIDMQQFFQAEKTKIHALLCQINTIPFVNMSVVLKNYDFLARNDAGLLWRLISYGLWYKKMVLQENLTAGLIHNTIN